RHSYQLSSGDNYHIMNSKDLMGLTHLPEYFKNKIDAVKIEGRMKSILYVANACKHYRLAIDAFEKNKSIDHMNSLTDALSQVSNRGFTDASLISPAQTSSISYDWNGYSKSLEYVGVIKSTKNNKALLETKQPISRGDGAYLMTPTQSSLMPLTLEIESLQGESLSQAVPNQHVWLNFPAPDHGILVR
ncbi:MAG: U32 family peptidase, partial [Candidatus Margulisiibacteriota bacterium]